MSTELAGTIVYGNSELSFVNDNEIQEQLDSDILPNTSSTQQIIGHTTTRDGIVIFSTDDLGMDCIWYITDVLRNAYEMKLLYVRNLGFSTEFPIQAIFNYENENIQKVYWVDGKHQIRFINLTHDNIEGNEPLIELPSTSIDFVGTIDFSQPYVTDRVGGGIHTAGMIQYAYNLYRLNSSQTKLSPLSELVPLDKGVNGGGGELNEVVGLTPIVRIDDIDLSYTHIKVYAIKYTSYNELPSINLIEDREIDSSTITLYDDGTTIASLSLEEFLFLGSSPTTPKHIETKDNRLFLSNIQTKEFILPDELDMRAYSFPINSSTTNVYNNISSVSDDVMTGDKLVVSNTTYAVPLSHDTINLNYNINKYTSNSTQLGGEGKYIKFKIVQKDITDSEDYRFLKDREIYRFGIEFYNSLGQTSLPEWVIDYKAPSGNLLGSYNTVNIELKAEFYTWLNSTTFESGDDKPVGYRIIRAERTSNDRTILCQGVLGSMMVNSVRDSESADLYTTQQKRDDSKLKPKLPNFLLRTFQELVPLKANSHLQAMQWDSTGQRAFNPLNEVQYKDSERKADTYQYSAMYQMYSPEILFSTVGVNSSTKFSIVGGAVNNNNAWWGQKRNFTTKITDNEGKATGKLTPHASGGQNFDINGRATDMMHRGLIADPHGSDADKFVQFNQFYREFSTFIPANYREYFIFGKPELTVRGQGNTNYNNNPNYVYSNNLEGFLSDGSDGWDQPGDLARSVISLNSYGNKCITFVGDNGTNSNTVAPHNRPLMETLYTASGINNTNTILISEFIRPKNDTYLGGIYNGNSYEDKKRTTYISIGSYNDIATTSVQIDSPGDTYVQDFKFVRIGKTDKEVYSNGTNQHTEIVSVKLETTVDLKNRNDISISQWDSRFQPTNIEYHQYNKVYSQQPTLIKSTDVAFTFKRINNFDTRLQSTKLKIPNESIDSWTDLLENEIMDLNGKYGPINGLASFADNIYTFQDEAIAAISINPRVQIQGSDGVGLELGKGGILYDFDYISTKSGSVNKWGIITTKKGIYYYDILNKAIGRVPDATKTMLSDVKGMHTYFNTHYNYDSLKKDNPILREGALFGYDNFNNDVYFTLLQGDESFTWCFNELKDNFIDLKTYKPSMYIYKGERFIIVPSNNRDLYEQYRGEYNKFFGQYQPSYITLQINPESDLDCVFDNIYFNSELYLDDIDQPDKTLTHIQAFNEYQDSGRIPLIFGRDKNLRRKFRQWKANIPRSGRNRVRNPWIFLKLELDNTSNYKFILHDVIISYSI